MSPSGSAGSSAPRASSEGVHVVPVSDGDAGRRLFRQLKQFEDDFPVPVPTPVARVLVGRLDVAARRFRFTVPVLTETDVIPGKGTIRTSVGLVSVQAVTVEIVFAVSANPTGFSVTIDGERTFAALPGTNSVVVPLGRADQAHFELRMGDVTANGDVTVERFAAGAGAVVIEALPIALVYCPVQARGRRNSVVFADERTVGTKILASQVTDNSHVSFDGLSQLAEGATKFAELLSSDLFKSTGGGVERDDRGGGEPGGAGGSILAIAAILPTIAIALKAFAGLVSASGSEVEQSGTELQVTNDKGLEAVSVRAELLPTPRGFGPGDNGEMFIVLTDVQAAWLAIDGDIKLSILSTPAWAALPTTALLADLDALAGTRADMRGPRTKLRAGAIQSLLALNPFVGQPNVPLTGQRFPRPRFRLADDPFERSLVPPSTHAEFKFETVSTQEDTTTRVQTSIFIDQARAGLLSHLGIGPAEDVDTSMKVSLSSMDRRTVGQRLTTTEIVDIDPDDTRFTTVALFDNLFGTTLFLPQRPTEPGSTV